MADHIKGTNGYEREAEALLVRYETISFDEAHGDILHLIPPVPALILDIGSGTGRDAAHLAALGHRVVAVEPTDALRRGAAVLHPSPAIEWVDDGLPDLVRLADRRERFDLVMMTAVWMHLAPAERARAMPVVASFIRPGGCLVMTLRHGTVPLGRRMFEVTAAETIALARAERLTLLLEQHRGSLQEPNRGAGITWTRLAFRRL
ncbi:class I SAM-dependent methyltransferase [Iodidimonas sp. SYSU 1G8]|uniref:class I SAM-dependent methyltransferase n=1 Tax=Iodidimonas sp. SYSU 1G8 TaxID=3133967 RepID=UPI0031FEFDFB